MESVFAASPLASPHKSPPTWERSTYLLLQRMNASPISRYGVVVDIDRSLGGLYARIACDRTRSKGIPESVQVFGCKVGVDVDEISDLQSNILNELDKVATLAFSTWYSSELRLMQLESASQSSNTYPVLNFDRTKEARLNFPR